MAQFVALGWSFTVEAEGDGRAAVLAELFDGLTGVDPAPGPGGAGADVHRYAVTEAAAASGEEGGARACDLALDGARLASGVSFAGAVTALVHDLNRRAITASPYLALHAGGVEVDGVTVMLPGHMEAGKTTLTAGLVRAGAGYLSDEAVALEWDSLRTVPYAKPLSVDAGAQVLFPDLDPRSALGEDGVLDQWQVAPSRLRAGGGVLGAGGAVPQVIVFPRYAPGATTTIEPVRGGEVLVELARNTFRFNQHGRRALDRLAALVGGARAYRLVSGDLDRAVDAVMKTAAAQP